MFYGAKNGCVSVHGDEMDYIVFGNGARTLVMLPGIGDGLKTARGMAVPFALMYRAFVKDFRVYVFSRRRKLPKEYATRDMARDQVLVMDALGIEKADVVGVSMGGMIAQWMAIDAPDRINRLVLAVTSPRLNDVLADSINAWLSYTQKGDHRGLMIDSALRMYSDAYLKKNRLLIPLMAMMGKPKSYERFDIMAKACLEHDAFERLGDIRAQTMIIAGAQDKALGAQSSVEMAEQIADSRIKIYEAYGHAVYEEAADFNQTVMRFLLEK